MSPAALETRRQQASDVPCGSCSACCKSDTIALGPKDNLMSYRWHLEAGRPVLDRKPGGECTYLTDEGCGIHGRAPDICKRFDCRVLLLMTPPARRVVRIAQNPTMKAVYEAGQSRLHTLQD